MSKIDDILNDLQNYLTGSDQSNTPQLRKLLSAYSEACAAAARQLQECKELISRGLLIDARKLADSMTPPLSARIERLTLPDDLRQQYENICQLYGYTPAAEFDRNVIVQLTTPGSYRQLNSLILRWRKIARRNNSAEKIKLLRAIIHCSPENDQIWRNNLLSVEQVWINELLSEAEKALRDNNGAELVKLYLALTDPLLLTRLPVNQLTIELMLLEDTPRK